MEEIFVPRASSCSKCNDIVEIENIYCSNCGYPEHGTEQDVARFHAGRAVASNRNWGAAKKIRSARNTLFVMSGISIVSGVFAFFTNYDSATLITNGILSIIYLVLGYWSVHKPVMALLLGLLLYLTTIIISAVLDPSTMISGFLWKGAIIFFLGKGLYSALSIKK